MWLQHVQHQQEGARVVEYLLHLCPSSWAHDTLTKKPASRRQQWFRRVLALILAILGSAMLLRGIRA